MAQSSYLGRYSLMSWILGLKDFASLQQEKQILQRSPGITLEKKNIYKKKTKTKNQSGNGLIPTHSGLRKGSSF